MTAFTLRGVDGSQQIGVEGALQVLERTFEGLSAPDLKRIIVDAALAGYYTTHDAEDLISFYGLRHV